MKKNSAAYKKMWLMLVTMIAAALIVAFAFTVLIYGILPQSALLLIAGAALLSVVVWIALVTYALERAYEPGKPVRRLAPAGSRDLTPATARS